MKRLSFTPGRPPGWMLVLFLLAAPSFAASAQAPPPALAPAIPDADMAARIGAVQAADYPDADVVTVLDRTHVTMEENGLSRMRFLRVDKVLTDAGALRESVRNFDYDPKSSDVQVVRIRIWHDGQSTEIDPATIRDIPAADWAIFWGNRTKVVQLPRLKKGDAVETELVRKGFVLALLAGDDAEQRFIPPMRGHFFDIVPFWADRPVKEKTYVLEIPRGKTLRTRFFNGTAESECRMDGEKNAYRWTCRDIAPLEHEPGAPAPDDIAPKLIVTTTLTWQEKSAWFHKVNEDYGSFEVTPDVKAMVDGLVKNAASDDEKIAILTHWAADNVRYCGLSMGKGEGFTLHKGEMTFQDRCGVCKDKAGILITMLRAAGFESYPAMTMAGSRVEDIPADQFNHCVTLVKRPGGYQLLDPTWVPGSMELWSSLESDQQYLMGVPESADLKSTPPANPAEHVIRYNATLALGADGLLKGDISLTSLGLGDSALRRIQNATPPARRASWVGSILAGIHPAMECLSWKTTPVEDLGQSMRVDISFRCPSFAQPGEKTLRMRSPALAQLLSDRGSAFFLTMRTDKPERKAPFALRNPGTWEWEESVALPPGYQLAKPPDEIALDGPAASLKRTVTVKPGGFVVTQRLIIKKKLVAPSEYGNLKQVLDAVRKERNRVFTISSEGGI